MCSDKSFYQYRTILYDEDLLFIRARVQITHQYTMESSTRSRCESRFSFDLPPIGLRVSKLTKDNLRNRHFKCGGLSQQSGPARQKKDFCCNVDFFIL